MAARAGTIQPTVFADVPEDSRLAQEEIFGPLLSVIRARDYAHALAIANNTEYGLTGGVYSRDRRHLEQARAEFEVGNLYFNRKITGAMVGARLLQVAAVARVDAAPSGRTQCCWRWRVHAP